VKLIKKKFKEKLKKSNKINSYENNIVYDYDIIMFIVKHISLVSGDDLSDMQKLKLVINFLETNNLKTNANIIST